MAARLRASEDALQSFTQRSNLLIDDGQGSVAETRLRLLQDQLARAEDDRIAKQSIYENIKNGTQNVSATDNTVEQYQVQLTALRKQLAEMQATYSPGYYKIPPLKAQIASLEKALADERQSALLRLENDYHTAARRGNCCTNNTTRSSATRPAIPRRWYGSMPSRKRSRRIGPSTRICWQGEGIQCGLGHAGQQHPGGRPR